jgi:hypothetical protein
MMTAGQAAGIRDSKRPEAGHLVVTAGNLGEFLAEVKAGEYDLPRLTRRRSARRPSEETPR